jgi:hypothetical protein
VKLKPTPVDLRLREEGLRAVRVSFALERDKAVKVLPLSSAPLQIWGKTN